METLEDIYASLMREHEDAQAARRTAVDGETLPEDGTTLEALYARKMAEHEAVCAANPYGCNQYGEGWAMPHNGMSRVPRGSVPKGGGTGAGAGSDGGGKSGEGGKENLRLSPEVHDKLVATVGVEATERFYRQMAKAPEDIRAFYERHKEFIKSFEKTKRTSHVWGANHVYINPSNMKKEDWKHEGGVLFHEIGHVLDTSLGKSENSAWGKYSAVELHNAIEKDFNALIKAKKEEIMAEAQALLNKHGGKVTNDLLDELVRDKKMQLWEKERYLAGQQYRLPKALLLAQGIKNVPVLGKLSIRNIEAGSRLAKEIKKGDPLVKGVVCDAFEGKAACRDMIGLGHAQKYYKNWGGTADGIETFANLYEGYALNDKKTMEKVEKLLPETTKVFKKILKKGTKQ